MRLPVVFSVSYHHPSEYLESIAKILPEGYEGPVLFDGLLATGLEYNRFTTLKVKDKVFDLTSGRTHQLHPKVQALCSYFYQVNLGLFEASVLSSNAVLEVLEQAKLLNQEELDAIGNGLLLAIRPNPEDSASVFLLDVTEHEVRVV